MCVCVYVHLDSLKFYMQCACFVHPIPSNLHRARYIIWGDNSICKCEWVWYCVVRGENELWEWVKDSPSMSQGCHQSGLCQLHHCVYVFVCVGGERGILMLNCSQLLFLIHTPKTHPSDPASAVREILMTPSLLHCCLQLDH